MRVAPKVKHQAEQLKVNTGAHAVAVAAVQTHAHAEAGVNCGDGFAQR